MRTLLCTLLFLLSASFKHANIHIDNDRIKIPIAIEIAATPEERKHGLMHRQHLDRQSGMLFIFPDEELQSFWMYQTHLPLDILFIDAQGRVTQIADATPFSTDSIDSNKPVKYVLELNQGFCHQYNISTGHKLSPIQHLSATNR